MLFMRRETNCNIIGCYVGLEEEEEEEEREREREI
jgi:hypothetical protein